MGRRVKLQLTGANSDGQHVRFSDFLIQFHALKTAFSNIERIISGNERPTVYFKIIDLSHHSPAVVTLEAQTFNNAVSNDLSLSVVDKFFDGLKQIRDNQDVSKEYDRATLESFKGLGATLRKHVTHIQISNDEVDIEYTTEMTRKIDRLLGPVNTDSGSISGKLDAINVHNRTNKFYLYPALGPKKVMCHFPEYMVDEAIAAIQRHIEVTGTFKYKRRDFFPFEIEVEKLKIFPRIEELPSLMSLRGIAPNATGHLDSVAFVRERRNAFG
jgi:hypothetical protein